MAKEKVASILSERSPKCPACKESITSLVKLKLSSKGTFTHDAVMICPNCETILGMGVS